MLCAFKEVSVLFLRSALNKWASDSNSRIYQIIRVEINQLTTLRTAPVTFFNNDLDLQQCGPDIEDF